MRSVRHAAIVLPRLSAYGRAPGLGGRFSGSFRTSMTGSMQPYLDVFSSLADARAADLQAQHGLVIKSGEGLGAAILKALKPAWTTDPPEQFLNTNGLFFSIWIDAACVKQNQVRYNLHAKKLRNIQGDAFPAREFARVFRAQVTNDLVGWPSVVYPKGPITLFEGHMPLNPKTLGADTSGLVDRFVGLVPTIERLLASAPVASPVAPA
jgi:hypothetical protein